MFVKLCFDAGFQVYSSLMVVIDGGSCVVFLDDCLCSFSVSLFDKDVDSVFTV